MNSSLSKLYKDEVKTNASGRRSYTVAFKKHVVETYLKNKSMNKCSREFKISRRCVSMWIRHSDELFSDQLAPDSRRVVSKENKSQHPELEKQLHAWIVSEREAKRPVTVPQIQQRMMELVYSNTSKAAASDVKEAGDEAAAAATVSRSPFVASRGWVYRFMTRHGLIQRNLSSNGKNFSTNIKADVNAFLDCFRQIVAAKDYKENEIINFAETSFYIDCPENRNEDRKKKLRLSVLMSASCAGYKLPLVCCIPKTIQIKDAIFPQCVLETYETEGFFSARALVENFFQRVLKAHMSLFNLSKVLLVLDQMRTHMSEGFKQAAKAMNVELIYIPDGLANILQPANVVWFKNLKPEYRTSFNDWQANQNLTEDDAKGPTYIEMVEWISESWDKLTRDVIKKSYKCTGYTNSDVKLYHAALRDIVTQNKVPASSAVVLSTEDEDKLPGAFMHDETAAYGIPASQGDHSANGSIPGSHENAEVNESLNESQSLTEEGDNADDDEVIVEHHLHPRAYHPSSTAVSNNMNFAAPCVYNSQMYSQAQNHLPDGHHNEYPPCPPIIGGNYSRYQHY